MQAINLWVFNLVVCGGLLTMVAYGVCVGVSHGVRTRQGCGWVGGWCFSEMVYTVRVAVCPSVLLWVYAAVLPISDRDMLPSCSKLCSLGLRCMQK